MNFRSVRSSILTTSLALGLLGAAPAAAQDAVRSAIEANNKRFAAAAAKADASAIADLYGAKALLYPPNAETVEGRGAIEALWKSVFDAGITNVSLTTREVESQGDLAVETGVYEMKLKDGKPVDRGKYLVVWKREGSQWKLHRDIWNSSMPAK